MKRLFNCVLVLNFLIIISSCVGSNNQPNSTDTQTDTQTENSKPTISLNGNAVIDISVFTQYTDQGAIAKDEMGGTVSVVTSGSVINDVIGTYILTYTATDSQGNQSSLTRTVNVLDTTAPSIELIGQSSTDLLVGNIYSEQGVDAADNYDNELQLVVSGQVDNTLLGAYDITYQVMDQSGNASNILTRTVNVIDTISPSIELIGLNEVNIEVGTEYQELGVNVTDNYNTDLQASLTGQVNAALKGRYVISYQAVDSSGNVSNIVTRTVNVRDPASPLITLIGENNIELLIGENYQELGALAKDNSGANINVVISGEVNNQIAGRYEITYQATDQQGNQSNILRTVIVKEFRAFITTWQTDMDGGVDKEITLGVSSDYDYNFTVDWGDGQQESNITSSIVHAYDQVGTYSISITGSYPLINFSDDCSKLKSIEQWGDMQWQSMHQAFMGCTDVNIVDIDAPNLSEVSDMSYMFSLVYLFNQDIGHWNVSSVTNMEGAFKYAFSFNQNLDNWDTASVTNMQEMFFSAADFNQSIESWNTSEVTNMSGMFREAKSFNQNINNWNVSSVINMNEMFNNSEHFNQPLDKWDVNSVKSMSRIFRGAVNFNQNIANWNVSNVTSFSGAFNGATQFNQDLSAWVVSSVTEMSSMFAYSGFDQDISLWDISSVKFMNGMFDETELSTVNYDLLLVSWSNQMPQDGVIFGAGSSRYSAGSIAQTARTALIETFGWAISDGGVVDNVQ
ncbi:BspA family leucine-rich repeat surface protein [Marinicellulosiphila megalodicopiae]|uniref:BspA family leucine-rich repeat surface protein n=1 Tax=Marinicellulosiphila megalodicopiae TaxID=2724896 RepID=UPI003BAE403F